MAPDPSDDTLFAAFIGPAWERHYHAAFDRLRAGGPFTLTWNRAAAFAPAWLAWRRMWALQAGANLLFGAVFLLLWAAIEQTGMAGDTVAATTSYVLTWLVVGALEGIQGDRVLLTRAQRAIDHARMRHDDPERVAAEVARAGGHSVAGAILVPGAMFALLVVLPRMFWNADPRDEAHRAALLADLRRLVAAEAAWHADFRTYTDTMPASWAVPGDTIPREGFVASTDVSITIRTATDRGWNATARHARSTRVCGVWVGDASAPVRGAREGVPACTEPREP